MLVHGDRTVELGLYIIQARLCCKQLRVRRPVGPAARAMHSRLESKGRVGILLLFGGAATSEFVLALLIGTVIGTYSSIFNAAQLLVVWQHWEDRRRGRPSLGRPAARSAS